MKIRKEKLKNIFIKMYTIRKCEETLAKATQQGLVFGACHTYIGQEAIAATVCEELENNDLIFSTHRGHGHALAKGLDPFELISELFGKETGCSKGRGGSMHLFKPEIGLMGTSGIVGPNILQSCGAGYSINLFNKNNVSISFFGDGAVNNGAFHEGLNMASIWRLPVIFICENNQYATEVPFSYSSGSKNVGNRGNNYGIKGYEIDGNDVFEIHRTIKLAIKDAKEDKRPSLIECKTYRTRSHAEGMIDYTYRTKEEVNKWRKECPIVKLENYFREKKIFNDKEIKKIKEKIDVKVAISYQKAKEAPFPKKSTALDFVFSDLPKKILNSDHHSSTNNKNMIQATHDVLDYEMERNDKIFVLGEGIGKRGGNFSTTLGLYEKYGQLRVCDTPICERGFVGLACGAAMTGARPIVDFMFIDFINDAFGEIINQIAKVQYMSSGKIKMPIILRGCIGIGHSAATHHSGSYYSLYSHVPGLIVVVPSNAYDAKGLFATALNCDNPILFLEHREIIMNKVEVPDAQYQIPFGAANIVIEGNELTVVALSKMLIIAKDVIKEMSDSNKYSIELIDPRCVSPIDYETILLSVKKTGRLLIIDEEFEPCSIASQISSKMSDIAFDYLDAPIKTLNGSFSPTPYSPCLESEIIPDSAIIKQKIIDMFNE
jgi:2-oxoisovalerate dehydrogenase E1 component|tara:strand:- start:3388 stop:5370 length:1983 start_codon:yes stop_codon:yes gene_type:complete